MVILETADFRPADRFIVVKDFERSRDLSRVRGSGKVFFTFHKD